MKSSSQRRGDIGSRGALGSATELGVGHLGLFFGQVEASVWHQRRDVLTARGPQSRIVELERELAAVTRQRDILKKAWHLGQEPTTLRGD